MKPTSVRIDYDETGSGQFKVAVGYHAGDTADRLAESANIVVYVPAQGCSLPQSAPEISKAAVAKARGFLQRILDES